MGTQSYSTTNAFSFWFEQGATFRERYTKWNRKLKVYKLAESKHIYHEIIDTTPIWVIFDAVNEIKVTLMGFIWKKLFKNYNFVFVKGMED